MARQAGGAARIESREARGTSVVLLLKFVQASDDGVASAATEELPPLPKAPTVLAVDDDPDVRQFLSDSLETLGFHVILAKTAHAAYRHWKHPFRTCCCWTSPCRECRAQRLRIGSESSDLTCLSCSRAAIRILPPSKGR
jgi:hypothetical protein